MKILILANCYPTKNAPFKGIFTHQQVKALQKLGAECHVIQPVNWFPPLGFHSMHPYWNQGYTQYNSMYAELEGVVVHHPKIFKKLPSRLFPNQSYEQSMGEAVAEYIQRTKQLRDADLIWANFLIPDAYAAVFFKRKTGIPLAASALGDDVHAWVENNLTAQQQLQTVFKESDLLLANSKRLSEDTQSWMSPNEIQKVYTIYNGIDHQKFCPVSSEGEKETLKKQFKLDPHKKHLICVATPVKLKGWIELLDAIQSLKGKFSDWKLIVVAPPRKESDGLDLLKESQTRGIEKSIVYFGQVAPNELASLLRASDAFVLPSYNEGMANALLEAMSSGLPVIATDVGGHREVISNGKEGLLIPSRSLEALTESMEKILIDQDLRKHLGSNARKRMLEFGSYEDNAQKLLTLFKETIQFNPSK